MMGNALRDSDTSSNHQQLDQVGVRLIDVGVNMSEVEVRSQRDGTELIESDEDNVQISCPHVKVMPLTDTTEQIHVPHIDSSTFRYNPESTRDSCMSTYGTRQWNTRNNTSIRWPYCCSIKAEKRKNIGMYKDGITS